MSTRWFRIGSAASGIVGVLMIIVSFSINAGPPPDATPEQLVAFGSQNFASILWGAWLQAVGPVLIVVFALALVFLAGANDRFVGWLTFFGGIILTVVSLVEVVCYIAALYPVPPSMALISVALAHAVQHLYFFVAAPTLFLPLGAVLLGSPVLPRIFGYLALLLGAAFAILGIAFLLTLVLPPAVTAFAGIQALWWLAAAITLIVQNERIPTDKRLPAG
ncbi:MAG TPA: hypothetical protein VFZ25_00425 [Chloroflexota bacterium]|nr:hypothetical protein [Chloroflexota bacterium]